MNLNLGRQQPCCLLRSIQPVKIQFTNTGKFTSSTKSCHRNYGKSYLRGHEMKNNSSVILRKLRKPSLWAWCHSEMPLQKGSHNISEKGEIR